MTFDKSVIKTETVFLLFSRVPTERAAKTRLSECCTPEERRDLSYAFLLDTMETLRSASNETGGDVSIFLTRPWETPDESGGDYTLPEWISLPLVNVQSEGDLGRRQAEAVRWAFEHGYRRAVILGSDTPTLPGEFLTDTDRKLADADVVFGPAEDGGYYLLGLSLEFEAAEFDRRIPPLFAGVPWSTDRVLTEMTKRSRGLGLKVRSLPMLNDIDDCRDLRRLARELEDQPERAPRTAAVLERLARFERPTPTRIRRKHC